MTRGFSIPKISEDHVFDTPIEQEESVIIEAGERRGAPSG